MILAEFGTGQVLWSIFWFSLFLLWILLVISVLGDVFGSRDLSGSAKAMWALALIALPYIGIFAYLIARGGGMAERAAEAGDRQDAKMRAAVQEMMDGSGTADGSGVADELSRLAEMQASGAIDASEFAAAKAKLLDT